MPRAARWRWKVGRRPSELGVIELARKFEAPCAAIIYTAIDRDGILTGINWETTLALADGSPLPCHCVPVGLASNEDITSHDATGCQKSSRAAISGRALYDGRIESG